MFSLVFQSFISMDCDEDAEVIPPSDAKVILLEAFVLPLEAFIHLTQYGTLKMIDLFVLTTAFTSD